MIDWKSYQGVEVITAQAGRGIVPRRHPRWGWNSKLDFDNVTLLLLSDDTQLVICDLCNFNGITGYDPYVKPEEEKTIKDQSNTLLSHFSGKHWVKNPRGPLYTDDQIRDVIKIWRKWHKSGVKNWSKLVIDELDRLGIKPHRGDEWTKGAASALVRTYGVTKKFKSVRAAALTDADRELIKKLAGLAVAEEEEIELPADGSGNPTVTIGAGGGGAPGATFTMAIGGGGTAGGVSKGHQVPTVTSVVVPVPEALAEAPSEASESLYVHLGELEDGTPLFKYLRKKNGHKTWIMMAGKRVKGIEV